MSATNDHKSVTAMPPPERFQFNLKFVLAVMAACAVSAAVVPFDWQPFCPLSMVVLVIGSVVINLGFWGWPPANRAAHAAAAICVALAAGVAFVSVCTPVGILTFPGFEGQQRPPIRDYIHAASWWLGGIAACVVANYVLIRRRRRAHREMHWSERQTDGRQ